MRKVLLFALCIVFALAPLTACANPAKPLTVNELLELGEKYLLDFDYEQALVQFLRVIEIEPMNTRGYTGAAEAYIGLGQIDEAIAILQDGLNTIPDNAEIQAMSDKVQSQEVYSSTIYSEPPDQDAEIKEYLSNLLASNDEGGHDAVLSYLDMDELIEILSQIRDFPFIMVNDTGDYGIGIYNEKGLFFYIGGYINGSRNGNGIWFDGSGNSRFEGEWVDDFPNGNGTVALFSTVSTTVKSGTLVNGLWEGIASLDDDFNANIQQIEYSNGKIVIFEERLFDGERIFFIGWEDGQDGVIPCGGYKESDIQLILEKKYGVRPFADSEW